MEFGTYTCLLMLVVFAKGITICDKDGDCSSGDCCFMTTEVSIRDNYCVPSVFCNKKVGGGSCMDPKECYSGCCVGMQCRSAEFCFDRYITPIVNGAALTLFLLFLCVLSCCYACRLSSRQKRLEQEISLIRYRLTQLMRATERNSQQNPPPPPAQAHA